MKKFSAFAAGILCPFALLAVSGWLYVRDAIQNFSARARPAGVEAALAGAARYAAMPASVRGRTNPVAPTPTVLAEGMAHYADHCAQCHANNGSGETMLGAGMYPKPPDMRLPGTQNRTDGELFSAIENGIRLSGMPAFGGGAGSEEQSWKLVIFLRHLPHLTPAEQQAMEHMNPKSPDELKEEQDEANFLSGGSPADAAPGEKRNHPVK